MSRRRCETCDQAERTAVRWAKMAERDGRVAIVREVPMEECLSCGARWLAMENAGQLDPMLRHMFDSHAETSTARWDDLAPFVA